MGEPGLGGSGPYRGPVNKEESKQHHDDHSESRELPIASIVKPPPPLTGQNPYEVGSFVVLEFGLRIYTSSVLSLPCV